VPKKPDDAIQHISQGSDTARELQVAVLKIADKWAERGFCPSCIVYQMILATTSLAQDGEWSADDVKRLVDSAYSPGAKHISHHEH
jgi:hypothetical protein